MTVGRGDGAGYPGPTPDEKLRRQLKAHLSEMAFDAEARFRVEIRYLPIGETRSSIASIGASLRKFADRPIQIINAKRHQEKSFTVGRQVTSNVAIIALR